MSKKKTDKTAQAFNDGYWYPNTIKKFGPGEKDPEKGSKRRRRNPFRDAKKGIA
jgi:hypothetical protein